MYLKVLNKDRIAYISRYQYPPIGEWTPFIDFLYMCHDGYHVTTPKNVHQWINDETGSLVVFRCTKRGTEKLVGDNKLVFQSVCLKEVLVDFSDGKTLKKFVKFFRKHIPEKIKRKTTKELYYDVSLNLLERYFARNLYSLRKGHVSIPSMTNILSKVNKNWFLDFVKELKNEK